MKTNKDIFIEKSETLERVVVELGPGGRRKYSGSITIDRLPLDEVDIVADLAQGMGFIPDAAVDLIYSSHFLEHIDDLEMLFREFHRVLKPGGRLISVVPHFSNPYFYSDYTHRNFWGLYTPFYFSSNNPYRRTVPCFYNDIDLDVESIYIRFKSPFRFRRYIKKMIGKLFNMNKYMQELYEENFCYLFPAYELEIIMVKR